MTTSEPVNVGLGLSDYSTDATTPYNSPELPYPPLIDLHLPSPLKTRRSPLRIHPQD
ncbi:hypothetical protein ABVK25_006089 [Lepraria finkii]|uniref:Uncharacterized protein n=1 Tax=Lepraria finkii TaxID=1340010 RepID=A0ABR4B7G1_9LECA